MERVTTVTTGHQAFTGESQPPDGGEGGATEAVLARLADAPIDPVARQWVAAALHDDAENALDACARGEAPPATAPPAPSESPQRPVYSFLSRIAVQGFRGIGRPAALEIPPSPGLTVIVGRNGSGKSSFAEAAEAALTGRNLRWDAMPTAWRDGWRNLHYDERTEVTVDLVQAGETAPTRVTRTWAGDSVRSGRGAVEWPGGETTTLRGLGWDSALVRYRPFLSYDELGRTVTGRAAELYDTITTLLGITDVAEAERRLARTCDKLAKQRDRPTRVLGQLVERLRDSNDPRAGRVVELLTASSIDLERLASIAADTGPADPENQVVLRRLRRLSVPERSLLTDVVNELRGAAMELAMTAGTKGDRARGIVELLRQAMEHQQRHPSDTDCPTCGATRAFGPGWVARAKAQITSLEPVAATAAAAYERAEAARDQARFLMAPMPSWLPADSELGRVWAQWEAGTHLTDLGELADHIENVGRQLRSTAVAARKEAGARLEDPTDGWAELAEQLSEWIDDARASMRAAEVLRPAEQALWWLTEQAREVRTGRLRPLAAHAEQVWHLLRQERHIDLEALRLVGRGTQRRVAVDVAVDGTEGDANSPGLLSQGEFQALALSICLPRTMVAGNPFGFLVIDDPVQAMDTETVEGLAGVLAEVGRHRQIIVFTHDTRLPDALGRLGLPAEIRTIQRDAMSNVQVLGHGH